MLVILILLVYLIVRRSGKKRVSGEKEEAEKVERELSGKIFKQLSGNSGNGCDADRQYGAGSFADDYVAGKTGNINLTIQETGRTEP